MDRKALAEILRGWADLWHRRTGHPLYVLATRLQERGCRIDATQLSKLINGRGGVKVRPEVIRALAAEAGADPTPALSLAGFVAGDGGDRLPARLRAFLYSLSDWELELLADHLPRWREEVQQLAFRLQGQKPVAVVAAARHHLADEEDTTALRASRIDEWRGSSTGGRQEGRPAEGQAG